MYLSQSAQSLRTFPSLTMLETVSQWNCVNPSLLLTTLDLLAAKGISFAEMISRKSDRQAKILNAEEILGMRKSCKVGGLRPSPICR